MSSDPPRLLHVRSQYGYTPRASEAIPAEPEAVAADEQARQTRDAARSASDRASAKARAARERIEHELDLIEQTTTNRHARSHVRAIRRQLAQMEQKLRQPPHA